MATNLTANRIAIRIRNARGRLARVINRLRKPGTSRIVPAALEAATARAVLEVTSIGNKPVESGLLAIEGWACSGEEVLKEGLVELAVDDEKEWVELTNRVDRPGGSTGNDGARTGFQAAINTFLLSNGAHRARLRVKTGSGQVAANRDATFRVHNSGSLAETTTRLIKSAAGHKRILVDPIDSSDFPFAKAGEVAWFERPDAERHVADVMRRHGLPAMYEPHLHHFLREGYIVLEGLVPQEVCQQINSDMDALFATGFYRLEFKGQRFEHLYEHSKATRDLWTHPEILKLLTAIFDDQAVPCQTLNFIHGSQQGIHHDLIHLTPFPQGLMCGVWVSLEDIHPDAGPLIVYPGSHRLPRLYTRTVGTEKVRPGSSWAEFAARYSPKVMEQINQAGLEPVYYTPKAGSALIWHENLAHGGSPRKNDELTRKSMVSHYFARGSVAFYDSTGVPAGKSPADDD